MKAVIPIAGMGTRMRPISTVIPKALMPLVAPTGAIESVLQVILTQIKQAGIDEATIIVSSGQQRILEGYLGEVRLSESNSLPSTIDYCEQPSPQGFGDAVYQAKGFVADDPFVLLLGDYIHINKLGERSCIEQVKDAYEAYKAQAMVGMQVVTKELLSLVGVASGEPVGDNVYRAICFVEKPSETTARELLGIASLKPDHYLAHCGIYVFDPVIFHFIERAAKEAKQTGAETELARAQAIMLKEYPESYYLCHIQGRSYDTGTPAMYAQAFDAWLKQEAVQ